MTASVSAVPAPTATLREGSTRAAPTVVAVASAAWHLFRQSVAPLPDCARQRRCRASGLAAGAVPRAAAARAGLLDRRTAARARLPGAAVDTELVLHAARGAVRVAIVAKRRALARDAAPQRAADATDELLHLSGGEVATRPQGVGPRPPERLGRVDVPDAGEQPLDRQERLDRRAPRRCRARAAPSPSSGGEPGELDRFRTEQSDTCRAAPRPRPARLGARRPPARGPAAS